MMNFRIISLIILLCLMLNIPNALAKDKSSELKKGITKLIVKRLDEKKSHTGAGIIISKDSQFIYILTALHVIVGSNRDKMEKYFEVLADEDDTNKIKIDIEFLDKTKKIVCGNLHKFNIDMDIAIVTAKAKSVTDCDVKARFKLGDLKKIKDPDPISVLGHPTDREWTFSAGNIKSIKTDEIEFTGDAVFPGNSGGVLLNNKKRLIGIVNSKAESGIAQKIDRVFDKLEEWKIKIDIKKPISKWWYVGGGAIIAGVVYAIICSTICSTDDGTEQTEDFPKPVGRPPLGK